MSKDLDSYNREGELAGLYAGGVVGGLFFGAFGDLIQSEHHTMLWYAIGTLVGGAGGYIAAVLFRKFVPQEGEANQESLEPSP